MQEHETIIEEGAVPPKKERPTAKIIGVILFFALIGGAVYFFTSGKGDDFTKNTLAIVAQSWNETLGVSGGGAVVTQVSLGSGFPPTEEPSSTTDRVTNSFSELISAPLSAKKKSTKDVLKVQCASSGIASIADTATTSVFSVDDHAQVSSVPPSNVIITDPIVVSESDAGSSFAGSGSGAVSSSSGKPLQCSFAGIATDGIAIAPRIILNEIAWMGSRADAGETVAKAANREWIELKNMTESAISLTGWQVADSAGNIHVTFGAGDELSSGEFYLLSRDGNAVRGFPSDKAYSGSLSNSGDTVAIFDAGCGVSDVLDASKGWRGGDNATKQTLERKIGGTDWQTSLLPGGTPRAENSVGAAQNLAAGVTPSLTYVVGVTIVGDGGGKITSKPAGISCSATGASVCTAEYKLGTSLILTATPGSNAMFAGWTGPCSGMGSCSFSVGGTISVMAQFHSTLSAVLANDSAPLDLVDDNPQSVQPSDVGETSSTDTLAAASSSSSFTSSSTPTVEETTSSPPQPTSVSLPTHIVIAQIQIAGASSSNDFVKIYNPTATPIDLGGWKLRKKSATGTDYSLRQFFQGSVIVPGGYFVWANSANGFAESIAADASSTETLSANNSVAIFDSGGATVDAVAWGIGSNQYGEGASYSQNPAASKILARKSSDGVLVDTGNNAEDFILR